MAAAKIGALPVRPFTAHGVVDSKFVTLSAARLQTDFESETTPESLVSA